MPLDNKEKFIQLLQQNKGIIYKVCNTYCSNKDNRDDLAQEIVYQLWRSFHHFNERLKFSTWMYRVALNVAISYYRKENKFKLHDELSENLVWFEDNAPDEIEDDLSVLLKFINELKEIDRSIMLLYLDDKSYKEIAEITGVTETNVSTRINRIKEKLRKHFITIKNK